MKKIKIAISTPDRAVVIPMEYDDEKDELVIDQMQIDPYPYKDEDISKDVALVLTQVILNALN